MQTILSYTDETDKAYGLTGSVITLVAADGEGYLEALDLDAEPSEAITMVPGVGLKANPRMSAKIIWSQAVKELRVFSLMAIGNVACRVYVQSHRTLSPDEEALLRSTVAEEAARHCELEADEADTLFNTNLRFVEQLFEHSSLHSVARSFSSSLIKRRQLSGAEAIEILASLGLR
ncbi:MAG: hypothetical protein K2F99_07655 [Muribaculaceae bacterium]|nr:hypothetical protein [Bacteroidales bacterium]MDE6041438.1 hypothetical protein [Muribaculaceae bacterium]